MLNSVEHHDLYEVLRRYYENKNKWADYERLIGKHADINAKDSKERTALHYAVFSNKTNMVELLLEAGAKTNIKDNVGKEPLSLTKSKEIIALFESLPARCLSSVMVSCLLAPFSLCLCRMI
ncbi:ankyrin repeat domain-containing protein [Wolbachia pipientis]|uniref:ankyrin repeat domain-containing protein n=1 Tax=Wolbachia pipientis TaxID=955 RepID=UPI0025A3B744|nr:ankyrin repeat domain-containing protein [Wolbachia pipientis]MDM8335396.1 ankyrin repeat domain-containing protein [Wolbachia pipientis]